MLYEEDELYDDADAYGDEYDDEDDGEPYYEEDANEYDINE